LNSNVLNSKVFGHSSVRMGARRVANASRTHPDARMCVKTLILYIRGNLDFADPRGRPRPSGPQNADFRGGRESIILTINLAIGWCVQYVDCTLISSIRPVLLVQWPNTTGPVALGLMASARMSSTDHVPKRGCRIRMENGQIVNRGDFTTVDRHKPHSGNWHRISPAHPNDCGARRTPPAGSVTRWVRADQ
jgi:hypothetical protein